MYLQKLIIKQRQTIDIAKWIALSTALMACLASIITYQSAGHTNRAIIFKNEAIMQTNQEANMWAFYQSKKTKLYLLEVLMLSTKDPKIIQDLQLKKKRYINETIELARKANIFRELANQANIKADQLMRPQIRFAQAMNSLQIAISIASMAALTKKYWLLWVSLLIFLVGLCLAITGWFF